MEVVLHGISIADLQYLRGALEAQVFHVRSAIDQARSEFKLNSDVDSKDFYNSYVTNLTDELQSLNGLLDLL